MNPERWREVKQLFAAASQVLAGERDLFLQRCCPDDGDLRLYVSGLLAIDQKADDFFSKFEVCLPEVHGHSAIKESWSAVWDLFSRGLLLPEEHREQLLQGVSGGAADTLRSLWIIAGQPTDRVFSPGDRIGRFEIVSPVGAGGMGEVYLAKDPDLARNVAIKVLPAALAGDLDRARRLRSEARAVSALNHPNILTIYELGEDHGRTFLVTEFLEGETLKEKLSSGPLPWQDAIAVALQIARGLQAAHQLGVVHRDIKPANIMVLPDRQVKILDFGLALSAGDRTDTQTGALMGSPPYMSPEQRVGQLVDARTDIWSLGVLMHEMFTGRLPSKARGLGTELPRRVGNILSRCMNADREERYRDVGDLIADIEALASGRPILSRRAIALAVAVTLTFSLGWLTVRNSTQGAGQRDRRKESGSAQRTHPEARDHYLKGQSALAQPGEAALKAAIEHFQHATRLEPAMVSAHIGMANAWFWLSSFYIRPHDAMPNMKRSALRAIQLDPDLADAHTALGNVALFYEWDWSAAEKHFQNAIRLDATSSAAHRGYGDYLISQRRFADGIEESRKAVELDPFSLATRAGFLITLVTIGKNDRTLEEAKRIIDLEPKFALAYATRALAHSGNQHHAEAVADAARAVAEERTPTNLGFFAYVHAAAGNRPAAFRALQDLRRLAATRYVCPFELGIAYAGFGDRDEAFRWIEKAMAERADCTAMLAAEPWTKGIRDDPRFTDLLKRMGLQKAYARR